MLIGKISAQIQTDTRMDGEVANAKWTANGFQLILCPKRYKLSMNCLKSSISNNCLVLIDKERISACHVANNIGGF